MSLKEKLKKAICKTTPYMMISTNDVYQMRDVVLEMYCKVCDENDSTFWEEPEECTVWDDNDRPWIVNGPYSLIHKGAEYIAYAIASETLYEPTQDLIDLHKTIKWFLAENPSHFLEFHGTGYVIIVDQF